ncbi:hypothetical protein AB4Z46_28475 [Variovorax sp. M-6]|uniref:hypothetical protein n=1 Tax=Variovorax sp. M-6 TaxID=3233041 RepID=UPI003F98184F
MRERRLKGFGLIAATGPRGRHDLFINLGEAAFASQELHLVRTALRLGDGAPNLAKVKLITRHGVHRSLACSSGDKKPILQSAAAFKGLTAQKKHDWRWECTEFQMLNRLDRDEQKLLPGGPGTPFSLQMWTEKAPCSSCTEVIAQFLDKYTSAHLTVTHKVRDDRVKPRASWARHAHRIDLGRHALWAALPWPEA